jgi:hypothetical protein
MNGVGVVGFFGLFILIVIVGVIFVFVKRSQQAKTMQNELAKHGVSVTKSIISDDRKVLLAIDEENKCLATVKLNGSTPIFKRYDFKDVISSEIVEDGEQIIKTSRGSQLGGAIVGGVLLGGVGAIIGGLSGKKKANDKVKEIKLLITVNDMQSPVYEVYFLKTTPTKKGSLIYKQAINSANEWHGLISVIVKRSDVEAAASTTGGNGKSVADELKKLSELLKEGIINQGDFESQKAKLLNM